MFIEDRLNIGQVVEDARSPMPSIKPARGAPEGERGFGSGGGG